MNEQGTEQNQHRIPRMLLKQFASDRAKRKIYEKDVHTNTGPREIEIKCATAELNAYSSETEDNLQRIEDQAGRVIKRLAKAYRRRKTTGEDKDDLVVREDEKEPLARFFNACMLRSGGAQMLRLPNERTLSDAKRMEYHDAAITDDGLVGKYLDKEFHVSPALPDGACFILGGTGVPVVDTGEEAPSTFFFPVSSFLCIAVADPGNSWVNEMIEHVRFAESLNAGLCQMHVSPCVYGRTAELLNRAFNDNVKRHYNR